MIDDDLVSHMRGVQIAERELHDIGAVWQLIEASAEIGCPVEVAPILPTLADTRERFDRLSNRLLALMVSGQTDALAARLLSRAQCGIDILVRNLYERSADVGFLAGDAVIAAFCLDPQPAGSAEALAVTRHLQAYRANYTVYDDIVLMAPDGRLLLRLDVPEESSPDDLQPPATPCRDPLRERALAAAGYVQDWGPSDLSATPGRPSLRFARRIVVGGRCVGVLLMRFAFADEMARIHGSMDDGGRTTLLLVDAEDRVVASNDVDHVPCGTRLRMPQPGGLRRIHHAGGEYLAVACAAAPYQGYGGPRWRSVAMVPLLAAFGQGPTRRERALPLDATDLIAVQRDADMINRELRRVVWNGRLNAVGQQRDMVRFKSVLRQVTQAGSRTRERLRQSLQELSMAALARCSEQAVQLARLAADIMDRNLYERANDCRWWASSPRLREALHAGDVAAVHEMLDAINGLYTVYSRLVVFDVEGRVSAASRADEAPAAAAPGSAVPVAWVEAVRGLQHARQYAVSDWSECALHAQGPTYVFLAAVREPGEGQRACGGIAAIFDAGRELPAMLHEVLGEVAGTAGFVDGQGRLLAATDMPLMQSLLAAEAVDVDVRAHDGHYHVLAEARAGGYREFKQADGYDNGVRAVIALRIGLVERRGAQYSDAHLVARQATGLPAAAPELEVAVFQVAYGRYALPSGLVLDAVPVRRLAPVGGPAAGPWAGLMQVDGLSGGPSRVVRVLCARQMFGIGYPGRDTDGVVLLLQQPSAPGEIALGLRVDEVLTVLDVPRAALLPAPAGLSQGVNRVAALIDCEACLPDRREPALVQLLDSQALFEAISPWLARSRAESVGT